MAGITSKPSSGPGRREWRRRAALRLAAVLLLAASPLSCFLFPVPPAGVGEAIAWSALPGWQADDPSEAWPALLMSCRTLGAREPEWEPVCADAAALLDPDSSTARAFLESRLVPYVIRGEAGAERGLITGYYEPLLQGSRTPDERFRYAIYGRPADLLVVDLGALYPSLAGRSVRGRLDGNRVVPYPSRADIEAGRAKIEAEPLVWVDDPVGLFFLHIQGSGQVELRDGTSIRVGYADQNGHPYRAIGRDLIAAGALERESVSLQSIRDWLRDNPERAEDTLNLNPSYIFFESRPASPPGPIGSLGVPLHPERSVAIDASLVPLGSPLWLDTTLPTESEAVPETPYRRLVLAQDTGGAIRGHVRADVFFGFGERAERLAGTMKQQGALYLIRPRTRGGSAD